MTESLRRNLRTLFVLSVSLKAQPAEGTQPGSLTVSGCSYLRGHHRDWSLSPQREPDAEPARENLSLFLPTVREEQGRHHQHRTDSETGLPGRI